MGTDLRTKRIEKWAKDTEREVKPAVKGGTKTNNNRKKVKPYRLRSLDRRFVVLTAARIDPDFPLVPLIERPFAIREVFSRRARQDYLHEDRLAPCRETGADRRRLVAGMFYCYSMAVEVTQELNHTSPRGFRWWQGAGFLPMNHEHTPYRRGEWRQYPETAPAKYLSNLEEIK